MTVVINGTTGITSVNGSAAAPSVTGTDTDTGIVYGTNTLSLATGGTTALTANSAQGIQVLNTIGVGNATPSTSGVGITFPATQSASTDANTLDDYEEGTWNATLTKPGASFTYSSRRCTYVKVGRQVFINVDINISVSNGGTTGATDYIYFDVPIPMETSSIVYQGGGGMQYNTFCATALEKLGLQNNRVYFLPAGVTSSESAAAIQSGRITFSASYYAST